MENIDEDSQIGLKRSRRARKTPSYFQDFETESSSVVKLSYEEEHKDTLSCSDTYSQSAKNNDMGDMYSKYVLLHYTGDPAGHLNVSCNDWLLTSQRMVYVPPHHDVLSVLFNSILPDQDEWGLRDYSEIVESSENLMDLFEKSVKSKIEKEATPPTPSRKDKDDGDILQGGTNKKRKLKALEISRKSYDVDTDTELESEPHPIIFPNRAKPEVLWSTNTSSPVPSTSKENSGIHLDLAQSEDIREMIRSTVKDAMSNTASQLGKLHNKIDNLPLKSALSEEGVRFVNSLKLPLTNLDRFKNFEAILNNQKYYEVLHAHFQCVGGDSTGAMARLILSIAMTNELATKFSLLGTRRQGWKLKYSFSATKLYKLIMESLVLRTQELPSKVQKDPPTHTSVRAAVKGWFENAQKRYENELRARSMVKNILSPPSKTKPIEKKACRQILSPVMGMRSPLHSSDDDLLSLTLIKNSKENRKRRGKTKAHHSSSKDKPVYKRLIVSSDSD